MRQHPQRTHYASDTHTHTHTHTHKVAIELRNEYVDTFSKVHATYFKAYLGRLLKLQHEEMADKDDMMGADDGGGRKGSSWGFSSKPSTKTRTTVFTIGKRNEILSELEAPILVPHALKEAGKDTRYVEGVI